MKKTLSIIITTITIALIGLISTKTVVKAETTPDTGAASTTSVKEVSLEVIKDKAAPLGKSVEEIKPADYVTAKENADYKVTFSWAAVKKDTKVGGDVFPEPITGKDNPAYVLSSDYSYYVMAVFKAVEGKDFKGEVNLNVNVEGCVAKKDDTSMTVFAPIAVKAAEKEDKQEEKDTRRGDIHITNNGGNGSIQTNIIGNSNSVTINAGTGWGGNNASSSNNGYNNNNNSNNNRSASINVQARFVKTKKNGKSVAQLSWNKVSGANYYYIEKDGEEIATVRGTSVKVKLKTGAFSDFTVVALKGDDEIASGDISFKVVNRRIVQ